MKPKPDTPEWSVWSAYSAGNRAYHAGLLLKDNPISVKQRLRDWWDAGWREAERQSRLDQAGPWKPGPTPKPFVKRGLKSRGMRLFGSRC
jgi:hypothetical protein